MKIHDGLVTRAQQLIDLHARIETAETAHDQQVLSRRIQGLDREVDQLVEEMYDLSEAEVEQVAQYVEQMGAA